jgi:hypothetical protein
MYREEGIQTSKCSSVTIDSRALQVFAACLLVHLGATSGGSPCVGFPVYPENDLGDANWQQENVQQA